MGSELVCEAELWVRPDGKRPNGTQNDPVLLFRRSGSIERVSGVLDRATSISAPTEPSGEYWLQLPRSRTLGLLIVEHPGLELIELYNRVARSDGPESATVWIREIERHVRDERGRLSLASGDAWFILRVSRLQSRRAA